MQVDALYCRVNQLTDLAELEYLFPNLRVLDASSNLLTDALTVPLCQLRMLFLASNQLTRVSVVPTIPTLEILSLSNNNIDTLEQMNPQPSLKVLSMCCNNIASLKGFPVFPNLETVRFSENPLCSEPLYMETVAAACGPALVRIDGQEFVRPDALSVRVGVAVREGMQLTDLDTADDEACDFLAELARRALAPATLSSATISGRPAEGSTLTAPAVFLDGTIMKTQYQWLRVNNGTDFTVIEGATSETYTATIDDVGYAIVVAVVPQQPDGSTTAVAYIVSADCTAAMPCITAMEICGETVEGQTLTIEAEYLGGVEGDSTVKWYAQPASGNGTRQLIAENTGSVELGLETVNCTIQVEYLPVRSDGVTGELATAESSVVLAARPTVVDVDVEGSLVEGNVVTGVGRYFGGEQGTCVFQWARGTSAGGPFAPVPGATAPQYELTLADVGNVLRFEFTPVSSRGVVGDAVSAVTAPVQPAKPQLRKLRIIGTLQESQELHVEADYFGGIEGPSEVSWSRKSAMLDDADWEPITTGRGHTCTLSADDVDCYVRATYRPVRSDGAAGLAVEAATTRPVDACVPRVEDVRLDGDAVEGGRLRGTGRYRGGREGESQGQFERVDTESGTSEKVGDGFEYTLKLDDVGHAIRFTYFPVREDGMRGTWLTKESAVVRPAAPRLTSLQLFGEPMEGTLLTVQKEYFGGHEGASRFRWLRARRDGVLEELDHPNLTSYNLTADDVDCVVSLEYLPVRADGERGERVVVQTKEPVVALPPRVTDVSLTPVLQEGVPVSIKYRYVGGKEGATTVTWRRVPADQVTSEGDQVATGRTFVPSQDDVGFVLVATVTPVRVDGMVGVPVVHTTKSFVAAAGPTVMNVAVEGAAVEAGTLRGVGRYFGGEPGTHLYQWIRELDGHVVARTQQYPISLDDIGSRLVFEWTPVRRDGVSGVPQSAVSDIVRANDPVASNVSLENVDGAYMLHYDYSGGREGRTAIEWQRVFEDNSAVAISGATGTTYQTQATDVGLRLRAVVTPGRADGVRGKPVASATVGPMDFKNIPVVTKMTVSGQTVEGETLTAAFVVAASFKGEVMLQWLRRAAAQDDWERIAKANRPTYVPTVDDVGCTLRVQATPMLDGTAGQPVSAATGTISSGAPQLLDSVIKVRGRGYFNSMFTLSGRYFGGRPGTPIIRWLRAPSRDAPYVEVPEATGQSYQGSADDLDCYLMAEYTPVREDGVRGATVGKEIGPLEMDSNVQMAIDSLLNVEATFPVQVLGEDGAQLDAPLARGLVINKEKIKVRPEKSVKTILKEDYNPHLRVLLHPREPTQLVLALNPVKSYEVLAATAADRDLIALLIRAHMKSAEAARGYARIAKSYERAAASPAAQRLRDWQAAVPWMKQGAVTSMLPSRPLSLKRASSVAAGAGASSSSSQLQRPAADA